MSVQTLIQLNPLLALLCVAAVILFMSFVRGQSIKTWKITMLSVAAIAASIYMFCYWNESTYLLNGLLLCDQFASWFCVLLLLILLVSVVLIPYDSDEISHSPPRIISLLMFSASGGMCMVFANHLVVFFVGAELLTLPLYILAGLGKDKMKSSEASFKYFLMGSIASAIFIYGTALIWASTGTMLISDITEIFDSMLYLTLPRSFWFGMGLVLASVLFKIGIYPFQFWIPETFDTAPVSVQSWMSSATSIASFGVLLRLFNNLPEIYYASSTSIASKWIVTLGMFSILSMIWGSLGGLFQKSVKKLLAYSHVTHMGYLLMFCSTAIGTSLHETFTILFFYICVYAFSNLIIFFSLSAVEGSGRLGISGLKGLSKQSPIVAVVLGFGFLSLLGFPPMGGFMAKFKLFYFVVSQGYAYLVVFAVITTVVSAVYYVHILSNMFLEDSKFGDSIDYQGNSRWILPLIAFLLLLVGILPQIMTSWL